MERQEHLYKIDKRECDICGGTKLHSFNCERQRDPRTREELKQLFEWKRMIDKEHNEEFIYEDKRDWFAVLHYPDRFEIRKQIYTWHE